MILAIALVTFVAEGDSLPDTRYAGNKDVSLQCPPLTAGDAWLGEDKYLHCYVSAAMTGAIYHLGAACGPGDRGNGRKALSLAALAGIGKEIYDYARKRHFSWKDLCWDGAGIALGYALLVFDH